MSNRKAMNSAFLSVALSLLALQGCAADNGGGPAAASPATPVAFDARVNATLSRAAVKLFDPAGSNPMQGVDDLNYGIKSGLLVSTVASGNCMCLFVEHLDPKACLSRVELQQKADLLTDVVIDTEAMVVTVKPNFIAQFLVWGGGPRAVAKYDKENPEFGCTLIEAGGNKAL